MTNEICPFLCDFSWKHLYSMILFFPSRWLPIFRTHSGCLYHVVSIENFNNFKHIHIQETEKKTKTTTKKNCSTNYECVSSMPAWLQLQYFEPNKIIYGISFAALCAIFLFHIKISSATRCLQFRRSMGTQTTGVYHVFIGCANLCAQCIKIKKKTHTHTMLIFISSPLQRSLTTTSAKLLVFHTQKNTTKRNPKNHTQRLVLMLSSEREICSSTAGLQFIHIVVCVCMCVRK